MQKTKVNYLAIFLCVIIGMSLPALWYWIFSETWMEANHLTEEIIEEKQNAGLYVIAFIANLITMYVLAWLFMKMNVKSGIRGALTALLLGIAFHFVVLYTQNSFAFRPSVLNFIDGGINLISWTIAGWILGSWRRYVPQ